MTERPISLWPWFYPKRTGDTGTDRSARVLQTNCAVSLIIVSFQMMLTIVFGDAEELPILAFAAMGLLSTLFVNKRGNYRWAARLASIVVLVTASLLVMFAKDGFRSIAMLIFPALLVLSVLLLDWVDYAVFAGLAILAVTALGIAEIHGILPLRTLTRTPTTYLTVIVVDFTLLSISIIGGLIARDARRNITDIRRTLDQLTASNGQLRRSERRYRSLIEGAVDAIFITDMNGMILDVNPRACTLAGLPQDKLLHSHIQSILSPPVPGSNVFPLDELRRGGAVVTISRINRADGSSLHVELNSARMPEERLQCFCRDITERVEMEQALAHAQRLEGIGRVAAGVAHDFSNLLTVINGHADMLSDQFPDQDSLTEIRSAGEQAALLTQKLLTFSRKELAKPQTVDLNVIISDFVRMLRRLIEEDIDLVCTLGSDMGAIVADPTGLHQVLLNLAVNARDAMPMGGRLSIATAAIDLSEAQLRARPGLNSGRHVVLTVSDTGHGMDEETRARIFDPFYSTKPVGHGTGLGLAIVYGVVQQCHGWIEVNSTIGRGTEFRLYFPASPAPFSQTPRTVMDPGELRGSETIMIVEDDKSVRAFTSAALAGYGYKVIEVETPADALTLAREKGEDIHLLLSDVVMPGMNGPELVARITEQFPQMRVLLISGYAPAGNSPGKSPSNDLPVLQKPFTPVSLAARVRQVLAS